MHAMNKVHIYKFSDRSMEIMTDQPTNHLQMDLRGYREVTLPLKEYLPTHFPKTNTVKISPKAGSV